MVLSLTAWGCGGQDSSNRMSDVAAGASEAAGDSAGAAGAAGAIADAVGIDPSAKSCLELVAKADWSGAIPTCTEAVNIAPDNTELRNALATAKSKAGEEATDAIKSATDDPAGLLGK